MDDESGNRCILNMVNLIDLWIKDADGLVDLLLLQPGNHQSSDVIGREEKLFPGIPEDDNRPCDSPTMAESETSTSGRKSGETSNVEGSSAEKKPRIKTPRIIGKGSMSPRTALNSRNTISATPMKSTSLSPKNVKSPKSTRGTESPVLKAHASSGSRNMLSNPTASTMKGLKTASSLGNNSTTSRTPKSPLGSSKGKESLRRSCSAMSHSTVKPRCTVSPRGILSADRKSVRSPLNTQMSLPSQSVGGLLNSPSGKIASGQSKLNRPKTTGPSSPINCSKPLKLTPARTKSGTFSTPSPRKQVSVALGAMSNLSRTTSKQTCQGFNNNSSSSLMKKKNGSISFPNKQVGTKCTGTPPLKASKITPVDIGNETEDVFLVIAEDDNSRFSTAKKKSLHNSITKHKSYSPVVTARIPLSSRDSLCNSSDSISASKEQKKQAILSLPKNTKQLSS